MTHPDEAPQSRLAALLAAIAEVEGLLADLAPDAPSRLGQVEKLAQLRAELATLEAGAAAALPPAAPQVNQSGQAGGVSFGVNTTVAGSVSVGDVVAGDKITQQTLYTAHYYGADAAEVAPLLRAYLAELAGACNPLSLADAESLDPKQDALELDAVYVGLELRRQLPLPPEDHAQQRERALTVIKDWGYAGLEDYAAIYNVSEKTALNHVINQLAPRAQQRPVRAIEALAAQPRLVFTGDPGSGKSSFVNFVSICLARAWRDEPGWLERLGADWPHGRLLPIRVVLRAFAQWLVTRPSAPADDAGLLWRWLEQGAGASPVLVRHLRAAFADGQALLLLDGLDEVAADASGQPLATVRAAIGALTGGSGRCLVTCRVLDYQDAARRLPDWPVDEIAPLAPPLREQLVTHWFAALERLKRPTRGEPAALRADLVRAIQARAELRRLAGNPLLLTMMIRLQAHDGTLPGERVELYGRSVDLLLLQWRRDAAGRAALGELLALPQWSDAQLHRLLDRLAYVAHERSVSGDSEQGADLPRHLLLDTAAEYFKRFDPDQDVSRAQTFLNYVSAHGNGILQRHDQGLYRFPHRTFQEYLAGRRLISDEDWPADQPQEFVDRALACSARGAQWREALLLAISAYAFNSQIRPARNLAEELLARYRDEGAARDLLLAAEVLLEVGAERIAARNAALWEQVRAALTALLQALTPERTARYPVGVRVRAGFLLGAIGDERMPLSLAQWREQIARLADADAEGYFRRIPAGDYRIGSDADDPDADDDEQPAHSVSISADYWIARFPITNAQWQRWVDAEGTASYYADDDHLNQPNQPVVGITWHAANAYCAWLSAQLADVLPHGYLIRLPSEAEWEAAARGAAARRYPWGDRWRDDCAATAEDRNERGWQWTVPVGCYPAGATAEGLLDMAGNVWEWTSDQWRSYPGAAKPFTNERLVAVRGGAHYSNRTYVRCGARDRYHPYYWLVALGVRVVLSSQLAQKF